MTYKIILPGAWSFQEDIQESLYVLKVPEPWQRTAKFLAQQRCRAGYARYPSVPVYSLDTIVSACIPSIVKAMRRGWQDSNYPWILATENTTDLTLLPILVQDWLREEFCWCLGQDFVEENLTAVENVPWQWEEEAISYSFENYTDNRYGLETRFDAITHYVAHEFLKNPVVNFGEHDQYELTFYKVVKLDKRAELISWPPIEIPLIKNQKDTGKTAYISFVISFGLQTVPWRSSPMIYHHLSIRRWVTQLEKYPYGGATVYIGDNHRWLDGSRQPFSLISLPLKKYGQDIRWHRGISQLLKTNDLSLPTPEELRSQPQYNWSEFLENNRIIQAAIAYSSRYGKPPCSAGVSPLDLTSLYQAIEQRIQDGQLPLIRVGQANKIVGKAYPLWKRTKTKTKADKYNPDPETLTTPMLRPSVATPAFFTQRKYPLQTILIVWQTHELKQVVIEQICQLLNLSHREIVNSDQDFNVSPIEEIDCRGEFGTIRIKTQHTSDFNQPLAIDVHSPPQQKQAERARLLEARAKEIQKYLLSTEEICGAIIEIKPKKSYKIRETDPKLAWRIGALKAGYLNQHIHALPKLNKRNEIGELQRVKNAIADLFRQFGILPQPLIDPINDVISHPCWLTVFYVIRRTGRTTASNLPNTVVLMLRVNPLTGYVEATTPAIKQEKEDKKEEIWIDYVEFQQGLLYEKWNPEEISNNDNVGEEENYQPDQKEKTLINSFIGDCLRDCLNTPIAETQDPYVLFMAEAQNARRLVPWLQNSKFDENSLPKPLQNKLTEAEAKRLWIVRLRHHSYFEVPMTIVKDDPGAKISAGGVFEWQCQNKFDHISVKFWLLLLENDCLAGILYLPKFPSIYLSLRKLQNTESGKSSLLKKQSRFDDGDKQAANPKPVEIVVMKHTDIDAGTLASFVHHLRDRWPYYADHVALPFPFPLAIKAAKEYAVSFRDRVDEVGSEEEEE